MYLSESLLIFPFHFETIHLYIVEHHRILLYKHGAVQINKHLHPCCNLIYGREAK